MGFSGRKCIGVAIGWPGGEWFSQEIMAGIDEAARAADCDVLALALRFSRDPDHAGDEAGTLALEYLGSDRIDGLVIVEGHEWIRRNPGLLRGRPAVSVVETLDGVPSFSIDNGPGLSAILDHLFDRHGYRNPVLVSGPSGVQDSRERLGMFLSALAARGISGGEDRVHYGNFTRADGVEAVKRFWGSGESRPDVFICANDYMAMGAMDALAELGVRVPEDVAVTGFDDVPVFKHYQGILSSVRQPVRELGRRAVAALADSLEGRTAPAGGGRLSTEPVIRSSCGCRPGPDKWIGAPHPVLSARTDAGSPIAPDRLAELLFQLESSDNLANQRLDLRIDQSVSSFCKAYIRDWGFDDHQAKEAGLLDALGAGDFYLVLLPGPQPGIGGEARLAVAWSGGERVALPPGGLGFPARDILPAAILAGRRSSLMAMGIAESQSRFGLYFLSPGVRGTNSFEKLGARLAESMRAVRSAREFKELSEKLKETSAKLEELSLSDELTGLYNRRGFLTFAAQQITYCRRQRQAFSILYMDLDGLKGINDTWGHESGDAALRAMAELLMKAFRSSDIVSRIGGDEFCVLAPNTANRRSDSILERLSSLLRSFNADGAHPWRLSMSVGEFHSDPADSSPIEAMMREADARLYQEKKTKRSAQAALSPTQGG